MPEPTETNETKTHSNGMRWKLPIGLSVAAMLGIVGIAAWQAWPEQFRFYTDGQDLRVNEKVAQVRDILWRAPAALPSSINLEADDYEPDIDEDAGVLYFVRGKPGDDANIHVSNRTAAEWSKPAALETINTDYDDLGPRISPDGLSLYLYSDRPGGFGGYDLWVAHRSSRDTAFGAPINLGPNVNTSWDEYSPALSPSGDKMYFASNRPVDEIDLEPKPRWSATIRENRRRTGYDLYVAAVTDAGCGKATPLDAINSTADEGTPTVSPAGDFLYFSSNRSGGAGGFDLYRVRINETVLGKIQPLGPSVNGPSDELDPVLSMEGFELHFSSNRTTTTAEVREGEPTYDIYRTTSREVYVTGETLQSGLDWGVLLGILGPGLLALLLLLLLLLLARMLTSSAWRGRLSLIMRCLLASVFLHVLLLTLFMFWKVTTTLTGLFDREGGVRVALASPVSNASLTSQIRGGFADAVVPTVQPEHNPRTFEHTIQPVKLARSISETPRATVPQPQREVQSQPLPDARAPLPSDATAMPHTDTLRFRESLAFKVPEASPVEPTTEQAIEMPTAVSTPVGIRSEAVHNPASPPTLSNASMTIAPVRLASHVVQATDSSPTTVRDADVIPTTHRSLKRLKVPVGPSSALNVTLPQSKATRSDSTEPETSLPIVVERSSNVRTHSMPTGTTAPGLLDFANALTSEQRAELATNSELFAGEADQVTDASPPTSAKPVHIKITPSHPTIALGMPVTQPSAVHAQEEQQIVPTAPTDHRSPPKLSLNIADAPQINDAQSPVAIDGPVALPAQMKAPDAPVQIAKTTPTPLPNLHTTGIPRISAPEIPLPLPATPQPTVNAIRGQVTDAHSGDPLTGAVVRLDLNEDATETGTTDAAGTYALQIGDVPEHFALSASFDGYVPASVSIPQEAVRERSLTVNFKLRRVDLSTVAIEAVPDVHHLGDDRFSGSVNSQFQKRSEGATYAVEFELSKLQVAPHMRRCELTMLTRGVQMGHPIYLNGQRTRLRLTPSPRNGSFGEFSAEVPIELIQQGTNTFAIRARSRGDDIDDFEFVNVQLHLSP